MPQESLRNKTFKGIIWSATERFSAQLISFIVMIVMARLLTPEDYGLVGMLTIFIAISQSLVDSGFSQALIRKQKCTIVDQSTVFYFNICVGGVLYTTFFFAAPLIAKFYSEPQLVPITRVVTLSILINSFAEVQRAIYISNVEFKIQTKVSLIASIIGGCIGCYMAFSGYGVWSIVSYQLINISINTILLWYYSKWHPIWAYSWSSFRELFGFGSKLAFCGIISTIYENIYLMVIGKKFSASDLGVFTRAQQFAAFPSVNLTSIIQRVIFPILCSIQDDEVRLTQAYEKFIRITGFVIFPLMIGLAAVAEPLVFLLLNPQWAFTATILRILCLSLMWFPICAVNMWLLEVKGRSDLFLRVEVLKRVIGVAILCITIPMGIIPMCIGAVITSLIWMAMNTFYTKRIIGLGFIRQIKSLLPSILYSFSMGVLVYLITLIEQSNAQKLIVGVISGILFYIGIAAITRSSDLKELLSLLKLKKTTDHK